MVYKDYSLDRLKLSNTTNPQDANGSKIKISSWKITMPYLKIWKDQQNKFRLTMRGANNEIIFTTEGYVNKSTVLNAIRLIKLTNDATRVVDLTLPKTTLGTLLKNK